MDTPFTVFLIDDDPAVLRALARMLEVKGYHTETFTSPREFLDTHDPEAPGCAIVDLSMPGLNGLGLQDTLMAAGDSLPIIFLTGKGDIRTSVQAMRAGAIDFLTKPVRYKDLVQSIARAQEADARNRQVHVEVKAVQAKIAALTPREREVLSHVIAGRLNKQIAANLGTVEKTIKVHRGRIMEKLGVRSVADLVRLCEKAGILPQAG